MTTLISDSRVARIEVIDAAEPLVDLSTRGVECAEQATALDRRRWVRRGVAARLVAADHALPPGMHLRVVEGFRPPRAQQEIYAGYCGQLRRTFPHLGEEAIHHLASRYVAPLHVAPHVAGAAVDLTLVDEAGRELAMGTPVDATPEESDNACAFEASSITSEARHNRALLATALESVGLVNYPTEWWHWSYGDRYWAYRTGADHALYGPVGFGTP